MTNKIVIGVVIGLVIGLLVGIFVSPIFNLPSIFNKGVGANNQVQVSGSIQESQVFEIEFVSIPNGTVSTSAPVTNGGYRALLIGGQSYTVYLYYGSESYDKYTFSLYVPSGITYFTTANF